MFKPFLASVAALTLLAACEPAMQSDTMTSDGAPMIGEPGCRLDPGDIRPGQTIMTDNEAALLLKVQNGTATGAEVAFVEECLNPFMVR